MSIKITRQKRPDRVIDHQKQIELIDKAYPYLMELSDICFTNRSGMTINVNGGKFEYIPDKSEIPNLIKALLEVSKETK